MPELLAQNSVLLSPILDHLLLALIHPTANRHQQELNRIEHSRPLLPILSTLPSSHKLAVNSIGSNFRAIRPSRMRKTGRPALCIKRFRNSTKTAPLTLPFSTMKRRWPRALTAEIMFSELRCPVLPTTGVCPLMPQGVPA